MKKWIAAACAASFLAFASGVSADTAGTVYTGQGLWCKTASGGIVCVRQTGTGYAVGFSRRFVMVMRFDRDGSSHTVFQKTQP